MSLVVLAYQYVTPRRSKVAMSPTTSLGGG
jgi:hypothetical protein